jgi:hypothetical protein
MGAVRGGCVEVISLTRCDNAAISFLWHSRQVRGHTGRRSIEAGGLASHSGGKEAHEWCSRLCVACVKVTRVKGPHTAAVAGLVLEINLARLISCTRSDQ